MNASIEHPNQERLAAFLAGKLGEAECIVVEEHVADCDVCRSAFASLPEDTLIGVLRSDTSVDDPVHQGENGLPTATSSVTSILDRHPRYRVIGLIGVGGMGAVYKAVHLLMKRTVALKIISPKLTGRPGMVERFIREVQTAARLDHPNIVKAYDAEQVGDLHFLVMEFVEGTSLADKVKQDGPLPVSTACDYICQAAEGLQHAFQLGMVHRDIKPHNLMLTPDGQVKVLDFGLSRFVSEAEVESTLTEVASPGSLTGTGTLVGTPDFISPEQASDARLSDIRADIYSLGCTLYYLLSGNSPFAGVDRAGMLEAHASAEPKPIHWLRSDVSPELSAVVVRMLAKDPAARFQTPAEVMRALAPFSRSASSPAAVASRATSPPPRRRRWLVLAAALLLIAVAIPLAQSARSIFDKEPKNVDPPVVFEDPATKGEPAVPLSAGERQAAEAKRLGVPIEITNSIGMKLRFIPSGKFMMGSPEAERSNPERESNEGPQHEVTITKAFYIGAHEVTQDQYQKVIGINPAHFHKANGGGPDHPVERVTWSNASDLCRKLSETQAERDAGRAYRLPTEAEWEYACRGGSSTAFHFGPGAQGFAQYDWCAENSKSKTHPVGRLKPNAFGLYDLHGNVSEWSNDWYGTYYYRISPAADPPGPGVDIFEPGKPKFRVARGGAYYDFAAHCRGAARRDKLLDDNGAGLGFRVVMVQRR